MKTKLNALAKNESWELVDQPPNVKSIGSKLAYRVKHKAYSLIEIYKDRLVRATIKYMV